MRAITTVTATMRAWLIMGALLATGLPATAEAHDFKPALLVITESPNPTGAAEPSSRADGVHEVLWRVPIEAASDSLRPVMPEGSERLGVPTRQREGDMLAERWRVRLPRPLPGEALRLAGSSGAVNEVLLRVELRDGVFTGRMARTGAAWQIFLVPARPDSAGIAATYLGLGIEHILTGLDHLAFVLGLVLLAAGWRQIVGAVTAFTLAHSVTLGLAALGWARVPGPPVEAVIALSIVFLSRELTARSSGSPAASPRRLAIVAFGFGLLHGLGFAGALAEVGLPAGDIPLALFTFNVGVELGQLGFVLLVLGIGRALRPALRALDHDGQARARRALQLVPAGAIGVLGTFWLCERIAGFF